MAKVFIITGTRKGIGKQLAEYYLSQGHIVIGCSRGSASIEHENYEHFSLDVSDESAVKKMGRAVKKAHKRIDVLLNNAGIAAMNHIITTPYTQAKTVFDTNFFGTFLLTREVAKVMIKQKSGKIVNYSTVAVPLRLKGEAIYAASKAAIENFTQVSAHELGEFGITVNAIGPTPVPTDLIKNVPQDKLDILLDKQAIRRFGKFEDILNVINFFIDDKSHFVTGQVIYLGGVTG
ncbi:MAG: SDR family oxidoreductase [Pseudomonadota bacterium]